MAGAKTRIVDGPLELGRLFFLDFSVELARPAGEVVQVAAGGAPRSGDGGGYWDISWLSGILRMRLRTNCLCFSR